MTRVVLSQSAVVVDVVDNVTSSGAECPEEAEEGMLLAEELALLVR